MPSQSQWKAWVLSALGDSAKPVAVNDLARDLSHTLADRLDPPMDEAAITRKVAAALRKLGASDQAVYESGWGWALADWRVREAPDAGAEPASPIEEARRAKTHDMIAKLQAKADSTPFPHEADALRAKVAELRARVGAI